ncbi:MAG: RICIN domain-containing protein [Chitinophagaceae bacterium]|nr:RICIN domain-containing protein [Oligoflexus sp.]
MPDKSLKIILPISALLVMTMGCLPGKGVDVPNAAPASASRSKSGDIIVIQQPATLPSPSPALPLSPAASPSPVVIVTPTPSPVIPSPPVVTQSIPNGKYSIKGFASSRCFDVPNSSAVDGQGLQIYDCNTTSAQTFVVEFTKDKYYKITNLGNGLAIQIHGANANAGALIEQGVYVGLDSQLFAIEGDAGSNNFRIVAKGTAMVITAASTIDLAPLQLDLGSTSINQRWTFNVAP